MQAMILAAGMGNRLGKYMQNNTKCMLPLNGRRLVERALDAISGASIHKCVIVAGYKKENVVSFLGDRYKDVDIEYVFNDVWNINSFAEYSLQIIGKYQKDYKIACKQIMEERARFKAELEKTGFFDVYPSQANYFLCRIKNGTSARSLAENFLKEQNILIKDLTGKKGIPSGSFVRLAVRDRNDNDVFAACLAHYMRDTPLSISRYTRVNYFHYYRNRRISGAGYGGFCKLLFQKVKSWNADT
jgi:hypothetical protein